MTIPTDSSSTPTPTPTPTPAPIMVPPPPHNKDAQASAPDAASAMSPPPVVQLTVQSNPLRQLTLSRDGVEVNLFLQQELYFVAEEVARQLDAAHAAQPAAAPLAPATADPDAPAAPAGPTTTDIEVLASFLAAIDARCRSGAFAGRQAASPAATAAPTPLASPTIAAAASAKADAHVPLLQAVFTEFHRRFVAGNSVHVAVAERMGFADETLADADDAAAAPAYAQVLAAYYAAADTLARRMPPGEARAQMLNLASRPPAPALFARATGAASASATGAAPTAVFAVFGGQGTNPNYLSELRRAATLFAPVVQPLLDAADAHLAALLARAALPIRGLFPHGLRVAHWLRHQAEAPAQSYLVAAPVSLPLIGLTQLVWYFATIKTTGASFADARAKWFVGATGHSQGLIPAVAIAAADSEEGFFRETLKALSLLFYIGTEATVAFPPTSVAPRIAQDAEQHGEGAPSPMLGVSGNLSLKALRAHMDETNRHLPEDKQVHLALVNGAKNSVVVGPPQSLYGLALRLRKMRAPADANEARVPHHKRGVKFNARFLPVTAPFHSAYLESAARRVSDLLATAGASVENEEQAACCPVWHPQDLAIPVFSTETGTDLRTLSVDNLAQVLVEQICLRPVHWEKATAHKPVTHFVDFGPGGPAGIGALIHRNKEGSGIQVILATVFADHLSQGLAGRVALYDARRDSVRFGANWAKEHHPRLVRVGNQIHLDTKFTRLIGRPPVMVAGMTPTTVSAKFVSAVLNAGYHVELAGGGHFTECLLRNKVKTIMGQVPPGNAITINMMFLNARQWAFQYPLVQALRREGYPVEGVCIAAGVPSFEVASEVLGSLAACGIKHVSFKPGSADTIRKVVRIAQAHPHLAIMLQWTGGRAGGHHSFEDMHQPILEHYAAIRRCRNLVLVAGSGFGGADDTLPYLTGDWATQFERPAMPFDAVLFGSRMLVAKEAETSDLVKELIVSCPGVENEADWEQSYVKPTGGILTVRSELGEPIHKVATRCVQFWKELDETIFNLAKDKRVAAIKEKRSYLIERLNRDSHRVWFGKKANGKVADLENMTYAEIARRFLELTYLRDLKRWIDNSYGSILTDFLLRVEERFTPLDANQVVSQVDGFRVREDPVAFVDEFLSKFARTERQLLTTEDLFFFITICKAPSRKPVPFVPVLDEAFEAWFKKDSLWQSEFIEAVVDQDPQRVCVLQGPVAARFADKTNVPVKEILDSVRDKHIESVLARYYAGDAEAVPTREHMRSFPIPVVASDSARGNIINSGHPSVKRVLELTGDEMPSQSRWLAVLTSNAPEWFRAVVLSQHIVQGQFFVDNYIQRLLSPRQGQVVSLGPNRFVLQLRNHSEPSMVMERGDDNVIRVTLTHFAEEKVSTLQLSFRYSAETPYALIHESMEVRNERIKEFYSKLWDTEIFEETVRQFKCTHVVDRHSISRFCNVIQNDAEPFVDKGQAQLAAPLDYAIVAGWTAVVQPLFSPLLDGDLLKLVHLSNAFKVLAPGSVVYAGDQITTDAEVVSITNTPTGKRIKVRGILSRGNEKLVEVTSAFFVRGVFNDYEQTFDTVTEEPIQLIVKRTQDLAVLESKDYIHFDPNSVVPVAVGSNLVFRLTTRMNYKSSAMFASLHTTGTIELLHKEQVFTVGRVEFASKDPIAVQASPVVAMLQRLGGVTVEQPCYFENNGYRINSSSFSAPLSNTAYASVSNDYNPIHTCPVFADLAGLPDTITHGMWSSAMTRRFVELHAAENQPSRVVSYDVEFVDMCLPGTELTTTLRHVGMQNGRKIIDVVTAVTGDGRVILKGSAHVSQAVTCFVFTGQGSQEKGMGMDLYQNSVVARDIWDRADRHFKQEYGFSILEIVRDNPKQKTVHFGGPRGRKIREKYRTMTYDSVDSEGMVHTKSLFPTITVDTESYTFNSPQGLLSATQFTQPALTLVEKAAFADMQAHGLIPPDCPFAGHSLGEYAALASVADVLPVESLVDIVFYRGMTMQHAVTRDATGRSDYGMCAVNPARVHRYFKEKDLEELVTHIRLVTGCLLEIVNYNVDGWQYVVAGDLQGLKALTLVVNAMAKGVYDQAKLEELVRNADLKAMQLDRGHATIPLPGIDVPFHSSFLLPGVTPFREYLKKKIRAEYIDPQSLENRYIPNLTAKPFQVTKEYVAQVAEQTTSPVLQSALECLKLETPEDKQFVAHMLLIELLAYQFASAVRWIETQDVLFANYKVERLVEVGPSATLVGMAERTLKLKYTGYDDALTFQRTNLSYSRNRSEIYYEFSEEQEAPASEIPRSDAPSTNAAPSAPVPASAAPSSSGGQAEEVPDEPISGSLLLGMIIAQKLKKPYADVPPSKSIKDLVGGKSTMQNEILGDLQKELGAIPERAEELPLQELGANIQVSGLGKHTSSVVAKVVSAKMPGGFTLTQVKEHLKATYGLGPLRADALLLLGSTMEPANRLASEDEAKKWLATIALEYAKVAGVQYRTSSSGSGGGSSAGPAISAAQLKTLFASQQQLWTAQLSALASALDIDLHAATNVIQQQQSNLDTMQAQLDLWNSEHGDFYAQGIQPMFEPAKARHFDSAWNWVRQDALELFFDIIYGRLRDVDRVLIAQCLHVMNRADHHVIQYMEYWLNHHLPFFIDIPSENYDLVRRLGRELVENCKAVLDVNPVYKCVEVPVGPTTSISDNGKLEYHETQRAGMRKLAAYVDKMKNESLLSIEDRVHNGWAKSSQKTETLFSAMYSVAGDGLTLAGKNVLITGCGRDSIGAAVLKGALSAGAKVIVTTSRFTQEVTAYYRAIYEQHGSRGSALVVVPYNAGSHADTQHLIQYIYNELRWDLDFVIPFAAISENGRELSDLDSKSELAHRLMLTNVLRLLGLVITEKRSREILTRPAHVLLPMSPNHGVFGSDGLYGESKIALETLLNRWASESWGEYLCVIGAVIGWTRGTGLMSSNNLVSEGVEKLGVYTFSTVEMAFNLLCLMHPSISHLAQEESLYVDLAGGMNRVANLKDHVTDLRSSLLGTSEVRRAVLDDREQDQNAIQPKKAPVMVTPRANLTFDFPDLPSYEKLSSKLGHLQGMVDLEKVVVVTGYGEVSPYGNARTRWEMESRGAFSLEGCIEMAWMMGYIRHHEGLLKGQQYAGWVDVETGNPVKDTEIKAKYEKLILEHTGIRLIEPALFEGYDPQRKTMLQEVILEEDLRPLEVSAEEAAHFMREHGPDKCVAKELPTGQWSVTLKRGATLFIPKALRFDRLVAGQIPTGWSARRYGVPEDIVQQVDPITLYVLVSTVEALVASGITDPYEFYKYVHVTEVGNTSGSGVGGMMANRKVYKDRFLDKPVQNDILQESFINTMAAWVNLLLLSSSGPIKTPVGACATAVESVEIGIDTIQSGKAKVVVVGGFDDFQEEGSYEFANMKATSNADVEMSMGREPREMCRPATSTRGGFMEAQGSGIQILMSATVAFEMGVPIYGVLALSNTATDKQGRSVPAPGKGVLTTARQVSTKHGAKSLSLAYRKKQIERGMKQISEWMEEEVEDLLQEAEVVSEDERATFIRERREVLERDAHRQAKSVLSMWGNDFWTRDPTIAPLRGALAVWGLTVDDIGVASFHGTGTKANDLNESRVLHGQLAHLGRTEGNPVPAVFQKYLTGHPKGAAAAWMMNGVLQVLQSGIIPGNRNADNIDPALREFTNILYPSVSIQSDGVKAGLLKSFGFGQVGGEVLVLHPHYVLATLRAHQYAEYAEKRAQRQAHTYRYWHDTLTGSRDFVAVKHEPPYSAEMEERVYLDPLARATWNAARGTYTFENGPKAAIPEKVSDAGKASKDKDWFLREISAHYRENGANGVGVDIELVSVFVGDEKADFIARNFTREEIAYCQGRPDPAASFAGRWAAKEAVIKAISSHDLTHSKVWTQGAGAPLVDIEVLPSPSGAPLVVLHGAALEARAAVGVKDVKVTISHSGEYAVAVANTAA